MSEQLQFDVPVEDVNNNVYLLKSQVGPGYTWVLYCNGTAQIAKGKGPVTLEDGYVCMVNQFFIKNWYFAGYFGGGWNNRQDIGWASGWYFKEKLPQAPSWMSGSWLGKSSPPPAPAGAFPTNTQ